MVFFIFHLFTGCIYEMFLLFLMSVVEIEGYDSICYQPTFFFIFGVFPLVLLFLFLFIIITW